MEQAELSNAGGTDWRSIASGLLRAAVFIQVAGWTYALHTRAGSSIGGVALMEWGISHATIAFHERLWSSVLLVAATILLIKPLAFLPFVIAAAVFADTAAAYRFGGDHFIEWIYGTHALRYGLPIATGVFLLSQKRWNALTTIWLLRIGLAIVFASHGLEAIRQHPRFIDLLIGTTRNFTGLSLSEASAVGILKVIGCADILVAILVLIRPWPALLGWLCFWSLITALSRMTTYGVMSFPEVLLRASHIIAPLAMYAIVRQFSFYTDTRNAPVASQEVPSLKPSPQVA